MIKKENKPKREPSQFDFCPKHRVFFVSCGCSWEKGKKEEDNTEMVPLEGKEE